MPRVQYTARLTIIGDVTDEERKVLNKAIGAKAEGVSWRIIASGAQDRSEEWFKLHLVPGFRELRNQQRGMSRAYAARGIYRRRYRKGQNWVNAELRESAIKLMAKVPIDNRNLTGRICGDPLPGRSALDKIKEQQFIDQLKKPEVRESLSKTFERAFA